MTRNKSAGVQRATGTLNLHQGAPPDWHRDLPAFAGDPYMDWESKPEQPSEPRLSLTEARDRRPGAR